MPQIANKVIESMTPTGLQNVEPTTRIILNVERPEDFRQSRFGIATKPPKRMPHSYRATVLAAITASDRWCTSHDLVGQTRLTYPQVVFALHALHNSEQIARKGRKFTAKWGVLSLVPEPEHNFATLESFIHAIARR